MVVLSGGVFLVALALQLGASNLVVGLLAAIPPLGNLLQVAAIFLVEKVRNRRLIAVVTATISRTMWLGIAAIPFFVPSKQRLTVLVIVLLARSLVVPFTSVAWNSWMRDLIPPDRLGSFFARRMRLSVGAGMMLSLGAGFFIDRWKVLFPNLGLQGYSILFFLASLAGLLGVYFISRTPEPRMPEVERSEFFAQRQLSLAVSWSAPGREVSLNTLSLRHWDFFFVSAFIIGLYAIHRLTPIVEEGDIDEKELMLQIFFERGKDLKSLSSIGGMRYMTQFVTAPARYMELKAKSRKEQDRDRHQ